jgi:predicted Zn-dependent peptidase
MRTQIVTSLLSIVVAGSIGCSLGNVSTERGALSRADEVAQFKPIQPEEWRLENGLRVVYLKDDELPLVKGRLFIRGGSLWGPDSPVGAMSAMGDQMRQGGAGSRSADVLDQELEELAATVSSSFSTEFGGVSFSSLASDLDKVFPIFADVALRPRFEGDRLALWKGQSLESIRRRKEDPSTVASIAFTQLLYGDSPYGRVSVDRDIQSISRDLLVSLHQKFVKPDGGLLVVTGRIERAAVEKLVQENFGGWRARGELLPPAPPVSHEPKPGIYFIELPFSQAAVQMGHLGVPRLTPDYPAIEMFNEVFGTSGFGSRLMQRVRTELGLTYGVYGGISPAVVKGVNYVFLQTKADSVAPAIQESIGVLANMQSAPPREEEMEEKRTAIQNSFVLNFDSIDDIAVRNARLKLLDYPGDYDQTYLAKVGEVTPASVQEVAQNRWDPKKFVIVVVGNETAYQRLERALADKNNPLSPLALYKLRFESAIVMP